MDGVARKGRYSATTAGLKGRRRWTEPASTSGRLVVLPAPGLEGLVAEAIAHLGGADPAFAALLAVDAHIPPGPPNGERGIILLADEEALVRRAVQRTPAAGLRVVLTRGRLCDNWFSHWDAPRRTALVSMADWDGTLAVPAVAFVANEIVRHGLRLVAPACDPDRLMHADARDCLFDFCETRADIEAKLRAAGLCPACATGLQAAGVPVARALRLAEAIRFLATSAQVVH